MSGAKTAMSRKRHEGSYLFIALRRVVKCFVAGDRNVSDARLWASCDARCRALICFIVCDFPQRIRRGPDAGRRYGLHRLTWLLSDEEWGTSLACILACTIRKTRQWLYALLIPASMPCRRYNAKPQCKKSDFAKFEDESIFPLGFSFLGQGLAFVLELSCSTRLNHQH